MLKPREYQTEAVNKVLFSWDEGITRQLISLPTGTGKTLTFGLVAKALQVPTLILAHREELLYQAEQKIKLIWPEADTGILKAGIHEGLHRNICIASVQTAVRHIPELILRGYKLIVCDEAHHAPSASYTKIFNSLGFMAGDTNKLLLGVTATAFRGDDKGLGEVFEDIVFERSILTMMQAGYLCDIRCLEINTGNDISCVHLQTGDFAANELAQVIDIPVVFGVKVEHAKHIAEAFRKRGIPCEAVYGAMPHDEREDVLRRYANHELQMLTNVGVLTEGWDVPDTDIIMMARPTKSKGLYVQCVGRGLRLAPEKKDCLLIDFVDIAKRHKLCNAGTLVGKDKLVTGKHTLLETMELEARDKEERTRLHEFRKPTVEHFDLFWQSRYSWGRVGAHYKLSLVDGQSLCCYSSNGAYIPMLLDDAGHSEQLANSPLPLDYAMGVCEDYARGISAGRQALKDAAWRSAPATEKQLAALNRMSIPAWTGITKGEAHDLMNNAFNRESATEKQIRYIQYHDLHPAPELLTKREAMKVIQQYKDKLAS